MLAKYIEKGGILSALDVCQLERYHQLGKGNYFFLFLFQRGVSINRKEYKKLIAKKDIILLRIICSTFVLSVIISLVLVDLLVLLFYPRSWEIFKVVKLSYSL